MNKRNLYLDAYEDSLGSGLVIGGCNGPCTYVGGYNKKGSKCKKFKDVYSQALKKDIRRCAEFQQPKAKSCKKYKQVYSPKLKKDVKRCAKYGGALGERCDEWEEVYSPALGHNVRRCKAYSQHGGDLNNKNAAKRSPWIHFLKSGEVPLYNGEQLEYNEILKMMGHNASYKQKVRQAYQEYKMG